jgi:uncharacterized membrane protein
LLLFGHARLLFLLPLLFWLFGPNLMIGATLVLVFVLYRLDRAADERQTLVPETEAVGQHEAVAGRIGAHPLRPTRAA